MENEYRMEKDYLGEKKVPDHAYWGIHTQRALENFALSNYKLPLPLVMSLVMVKKACTMANSELHHLDEKKAKGILLACEEILEGKLLDQFPVDALQGGAGTSSNMNVNEVIANRAAEMMGGKKGEYKLVHPIEDVNKHQSTNDVYPTAVKVACIMGFRRLSLAVSGLQGAFQQKEKEFADIIKIGRTELQEAVPITLGAEFSAFAEALSRDRWRTFKCEERLRVVNIGGTAVGTGIGSPQSYIFLVIEKLRDVTGLGLSRGENVLDQTANMDSFVEVSGTLKALAANLIKICNDLRILNLLGEIELPKLQTGSSIMPGKINPVILEAAIQAGMKAIANDNVVTEAAARGTFQINEFIPLLAFSILESIELLLNACKMLEKHVKEIHAHPEKCREFSDKSLTIVTAFLPEIGYEKASQLLKDFLFSGESSFRGFLEKTLGKELVEKTLTPQNLMSLGYRENEKNA
jgi:aspartate ammonia-lyase